MWPLPAWPNGLLMASPDHSDITWLVTVRFGSWQLVDVSLEWEDNILDSLESLDILKKLVFRHLAITSEGSLGTKGGFCQTQSHRLSTHNSSGVPYLGQRKSRRAIQS